MDDKDIFNRVFDKLDRQEERLSTTCNTITRIDQKLSDFINAVEKKHQEEKEKSDSKFKKLSVLFGVITGISVIINLVRSFHG